MLAVQTDGLGKAYDDAFGGRRQVALDGVTLHVPRGIVFGLIGLNGAGKTTLIKSLLGVVRPTSGLVRVLGGDPDDVRVRARVGYLPERLHLPHASTPTAFLASIARLRRLRLGHDALRSVLARVGLGDDTDRRMGSFSKGMKQRVGLAAALLGEPDFLVLDEPSDGVDPLGRVEIRRILAQERDRGATVLLNSHLLSETERVCDRVGVLHRGRLVREGTLEELCGSGKRWRARFAPGADRSALVALGFRPEVDGDALTCEADDAAALNALLDRARLAGGLLVELGRELRDLEDVLSQSIGAAA